MDLHEARRLMWLQLADQVHIGGDNGPQHKIASTRDCVAVQHDRLRPTRHLDRAIGIAAVDYVGRVGARAKWLFARDESERTAASETVSYAVSLGRHLPSVLEEILAGFLGDPAPVEPWQGAQFSRLAGQAPHVRRHDPTSFRLSGRVAQC